MFGKLYRLRYNFGCLWRFPEDNSSYGPLPVRPLGALDLWRLDFERLAPWAQKPREWKLGEFPAVTKVDGLPPAPSFGPRRLCVLGRVYKTRCRLRQVAARIVDRRTLAWPTHHPPPGFFSETLFSSKSYPGMTRRASPRAKRRSLRVIRTRWQASWLEKSRRTF